MHAHIIYASASHVYTLTSLCAVVIDTEIAREMPSKQCTLISSM
jgi:hypothetical protein